MATSTDVDGLALNVWFTGDDETVKWQMAIYPDTAHGIDSSQYILIDPTPEQIERYNELSQDSDWWTDDQSAEFNYVLRGEK